MYLRKHIFFKPNNFLPRCFQLLLILIFQYLILHFVFRAPPEPEPESKINIPVYQNCPYGKVYVYDLPPMFNEDLLADCRHLDPWQSRCNAVSNSGLGPRAAGLSSIPKNLSSSWYWTDMFAGEVLYHRRALRHPCRTADPTSAAAFYVPFYAGLEVGKHLFAQNRSGARTDALCELALTWLSEQLTWRRSNGSDHFMMLGRMTWDFRRTGDGDWGSGLVHMPLMARVLRLAVERDPWDRLEVGVPYPTGFHPRSKSEIDEWVDFVRGRERGSLFTFVGGKRDVEGDFRALLLSHCYNESDVCRVVDCSMSNKCYDGTWEIMEAFLGSDFCLQPRGDAYTRRSTFDCMLAGSIPVFFWKRSVYDQYEWFVGDEPGEFSVLIDRKEVRKGIRSIREVLEGYSRDEVRRMREKVMGIIPRIVYGDMNEDEVGYKDAFDIAIDGVLKRFQANKNSNKLGHV